MCATFLPHYFFTIPPFSPSSSLPPPILLPNYFLLIFSPSLFSILLPHSFHLSLSQLLHISILSCFYLLPVPVPYPSPILHSHPFSSTFLPCSGRHGGHCGHTLQSRWSAQRIRSKKSLCFCFPWRVFRYCLHSLLLTACLPQCLPACLHYFLLFLLAVYHTFYPSWFLSFCLYSTLLSSFFFFNHSSTWFILLPSPSYPSSSTPFFIFSLSLHLHS